MSYQDEYIHEYIQKLDREQSREVQNVLSQVLSVSYPENSSMHVWLEKPESWIAVPIAPGDNLTRFANVVLRLAADKSYRELLEFA